MEKNVLCVVMLRPEAYDEILKHKVNENWFFYPENRMVFNAISSLHENNLPIDMLTVEHKLSSDGVLEDLGGSTYLDGLIERSSIAAHIGYFLDVLCDLHMKREVILPALQKASADLNSDTDSMSIISELVHSVDSLDSVDHLELDSDVLKAKIAARRLEATAGYMGVDSKFKSLQAILGGYRRGKVCLYGARTSVGKTTIALNEIRYHITKKHNPTNVALFSLETDIDEIYEQLAAEHIGLNLHEYAKGNVTDSELLDKFDKGIAWYCERPLYVTENGMDIDQLCFNISYLARKKQVTLGFVDFIQIIQDNHVMQKMPSVRNKITYLSKRLFNAFRDANMAGIVLTQLRRDADIPFDCKPENRWKHIPQLHHLKESGSLEEDAYQIILFSHDPDELNPKTVLEVDILANVLKNKRGETGAVFLHHKKGAQRVTSSSRKVGWSKA
jgi:replicative DNA helicase